MGTEGIKLWPPRSRPRPLKVWGGLTTGLDTNAQRRTIVAATTRRRALELLAKLWMGAMSASSGSIDRITAHRFDGWWSITGNEIELKIATEEGVWVKTGNSHHSTGKYVRKQL